MTEQDVQLLQERTQVLWGAQLWRVRVHIEHRFEHEYAPSDLDCLELEFQVPIEEPARIRTHRKIGSLWISATHCGVRLHDDGGVRVASSDSPAKVLAEFPQLVEDTLLRMDVTAPAGDTTLVFASGRTLHIFPAAGHSAYAWRMYLKNDDVVEFGPGARWTYEAGVR